MKDRIIIHDKAFKPFIMHDDIIEAIDKVAVKINNDFKDSGEVPLLLCVLNGSILFTSELIQRLDFDCELASIKASSYRGMFSEGMSLSELGSLSDISGRTIIICEDIIDTGNTIVALKERLSSKGAKEIKICTLLLKPEVYDKDVKLDYVAIEIPNKFIVGFGLDYDQLGRNYRDIYILE